MERLNPKRRCFVQQYLIHLDAPRAAREAGYSARSARNQAYRMMTNDDVRTAIAEGMKAREERVRLSQDDVVRALMHIAFSSIFDVLAVENECIYLQDSETLDRAKRSGVKEIRATKTDTRSSIQVTMHDNTRALELLAKYVGLFTKKDSDMTTTIAVLPRSREEARRRAVDWVDKLLEEQLGSVSC
jgi:phage terminase small subunit